MGNASNWVIRVQDPSGSTVQGFWGWFNGNEVKFDADPTTHQVSLAAIKGAIKLTFDKVASPQYYNCVSAEFTGYLPRIYAMSIVTIYTLGSLPGELTDTYYARFSGRAEVLASPDELVPIEDNFEYRIVGHAEELKTSVDNNKQYPQGANFLNTLSDIATPNIPVSVLAADVSTNLLSLTLDQLYNPNYALLNEVFDSFADKSRAKNQNVQWGINGRRSLWMHPKDSGIFTVDERDVNHDVEWPNNVAQDYWNRVRWEISSGNLSTFFYPNASGLPTLETPDLVTHVSSIGYGPYLKTKPVEVPSDVIALRPLPTAYTTTPGAGEVGYELVTGQAIASFLGNTQDVSVNLSRMIDGNPSSFVVYEQEPPFTPLSVNQDLRIDVRFGSGIAVKDVVAFKLRMKPDSSGQANEPVGAYPLRATIFIRNAASEDIFLSQEIDSFKEIDGYFIVGDTGRNVFGNTVAPTISIWFDLFRGVGQPNPVRISIEDFRFFTLDMAELNLQANKEYNVPTSAQFKAGKHGFHALQPLASVTRKDGFTYTVAPERYEVFISGEKDTMTYALVGAGALFGLEGLPALKVRQQDRLERSKAAKASLRRTP
jgi:hypothetical protein